MNGAWPGLARWAGEISDLTAASERSSVRPSQDWHVRRLLHLVICPEVDKFLGSQLIYWHGAQNPPGSGGPYRDQEQRKCPVVSRHSVFIVLRADPVASAGGTEWCRIIRLSSAQRVTVTGAVLPDSAARDQTADRDDAPGGEILRLPSDAGPPQWRHRYRGMAPKSLNLYTHLESLAEVVRTYEPHVIPALLQVEAYARAILTRYCPDASDQEITRLVELRLRRQARLREPRFRLWAVIDETALRSQQASARAMRSQITHLINMTEEANVTLQLVNLAQMPGLDDHVAIKEPITHFRFPEERLDDVVFIERPPDGVMLTDRKGTAHYSQLMSRLGIRAARARDAQDHLREIFMEL